MKTNLTRFLAAAFVSLILAVIARAYEFEFYAAQYSGGGTSNQNVEGDWSTDNPYCYSTMSSPNAPATDLSMPFFNPNGPCLFTISFSTNVAKDEYYIGTFPGSSSDFYVEIF